MTIIDTHLRLIDAADLPRSEWDTPERRGLVARAIRDGRLCWWCTVTRSDAEFLARAYGHDGAVTNGDEQLAKECGVPTEWVQKARESRNLRNMIGRLIAYHLAALDVLRLIAERPRTREEVYEAAYDREQVHADTPLIHVAADGPEVIVDMILTESGFVAVAEAEALADAVYEITDAGRQHLAALTAT